MNEEQLRQLAMLRGNFSINGQDVHGGAIIDQPDAPLDMNIVRRLMTSPTVSPAQANHQASLGNIMRQARFQAQGYTMDELGDTSNKLEEIARETDNANAAIATEQNKLTKAGLAAQAISQQPSASNRKMLAALAANFGVNVDPAVDSFVTYPQLFQMHQQEQDMALKQQQLALQQQALALKASAHSGGGSGGGSGGATGKQMSKTDYMAAVEEMDDKAYEVVNAPTLEDAQASYNALQNIVAEKAALHGGDDSLVGLLYEKLQNDTGYIDWRYTGADSSGTPVKWGNWGTMDDATWKEEMAAETERKRLAQQNGQ